MTDEAHVPMLDDRCGHGITWQKKCLYCGTVWKNYGWELTPIDFASREPPSPPDPFEEAAKAFFSSLYSSHKETWANLTFDDREYWRRLVRGAVDAYHQATGMSRS